MVLCHFMPSYFCRNSPKSHHLTTLNLGKTCPWYQSYPDLPFVCLPFSQFVLFLFLRVLIFISSGMLITSQLLTVLLSFSKKSELLMSFLFCFICFATNLRNSPASFPFKRNSYLPSRTQFYTSSEQFHCAAKRRLP